MGLAGKEREQVPLGAFADRNPGLSWLLPFQTLSKPCQVCPGVDLTWCCHWNKLNR